MKGDPFPQVTAALRDAFRLDPRDIKRQTNKTRCEVYSVITAVGKVGIKIYPPEYRDEELSSEIEFANYLAGRGLNVTEFLKTSDGEDFVPLPGGRKTAIYYWAEGSIHRKYRPGDLQAITAAIASIHSASQVLDLKRNDDWLWEEASHYLKQIAPRPKNAATYNAIVRGGRPWSTTDNLILCHGDYGINNIVWGSDKQPIVIDFTNAIRAPREWDLAGLCADVCLRTNGIDAIAVLDSATGCYRQLVPQFDRMRLISLFFVALIQRATFLAYTTHADRHSMIWKAVDVACDAVKSRLMI